MSYQSGMNGKDGAASWVASAVKRNPEGLLLLAAGAALLLRSRASAQRATQSGPQASGAWANEWQRAHTGGSSSGHNDRGIQRTAAQATEQAKEYASGMAEQAKDYAAGMTDRAAELTDRASESVKSYASAATDAIHGAQNQAMEKMHDWQHQASDYAHRFAGEAQTTFQNTVDYVRREQPLAVAAAGVAAGMAVAAMFPSTRFERQTLGELGTQITEAEPLERWRETAEKAGERLKAAMDDPSKIRENVEGLVSDVTRALNSDGDEANKDKRQDAARSSLPAASSSSDRPGTQASGSSTGTPGTGPSSGGFGRG